MNALMALWLFAGPVLRLDYNCCLYLSCDLLLLCTVCAQIVNGVVNLLCSY